MMAMVSDALVSCTSVAENSVTWQVVCLRGRDLRDCNAQAQDMVVRMNREAGEGKYRLVGVSFSGAFDGWVGAEYSGGLMRGGM